MSYLLTKMPNISPKALYNAITSNPYEASKKAAVGVAIVGIAALVGSQFIEQEYMHDFMKVKGLGAGLLGIGYRLGIEVSERYSKLAASYSPITTYRGLRNKYFATQLIAIGVGITGTIMAGISGGVGSLNEFKDIAEFTMMAVPGAYLIGSMMPGSHLRNRTNPRNDQSPDLEARTQGPDLDLGLKTD